jgi:cell division protein FtsB
MSWQRGARTGDGTWLGVHWRALSIVVAICTICGLLLVLFLTRDAKIQQLKRELAALREEQRQAALEQDELRQQLASSSDADVIEREAREKLGLVKPGEVKVIFVED